MSSHLVHKKYVFLYRGTSLEGQLVNCSEYFVIGIHFFLNTFIVYAHVSFPSDICLELSCLLDFSWKFYSQLYELCFLIHTYICDFVPAEVITSAEFHPVHCNTLAYSSSRGSIRLIDLRQSALCDNHSQLCVIFLNLMEFYFPRLKQDTK